MRWYVVIFFVLLFLLVQHQDVYAAETASSNITDKMVNQQLDQLGIDELKGYWQNIVTQYNGFLPDSQKGSLMDFIKGDKHFSLSEWLQGISKYLLQELWMNWKLLMTLMLLTIFSVFLQSLHHAFENTTINKVAYAICFMVLVMIALNSLHVTFEYAKDAISTMSKFIIALLPLLLALISASGGVTTAAFFHPVILFLVNTSGFLVQYIILPFIIFSTLLSIVSSISEQYKATQLAQLLRNGAIGLLGVFMTIFLGVVSVQGTATAVSDGLAIRTAKFVSGNFIPVIGRMFTDAADTVLSASVLLKNTLGIAGVAIVLLIAAFPAIKIFAVAIIFKLTAALLQPLGNGPIIGCLDVISKNMIYIFASLALVSIMFFLSLAIIIVAGNVTMMMR